MSTLKIASQLGRAIFFTFRSNYTNRKKDLTGISEDKCDRIVFLQISCGWCLDCRHYSHHIFLYSHTSFYRSEEF